MKICHISDNHSKFFEIPDESDVVVCSGDFFPNHRFGPNKNKETRTKEIAYQTAWLKYHLNEIRKWLKGKPLLWSSGNHDFINPCSFLNENGVEAIDLDNKVVNFNGYTWYGFPYVPMIRNDWNWEKDQEDLRQEVIKFLERLKDSNIFNTLDIIVAHCPLHGLLDSEKDNHIGNRFMLNAMTYQIGKLPKAYLCGHAHKQCGVSSLESMYISNAACTARLIDI